MAADSRYFVFKQDGALPYWNIEISQLLIDDLLHRCVECVNRITSLFPRPPHSLPYLKRLVTPSFEGILRTFFLYPQYKTLEELRARINGAVMSIDRMML